MKEKKPNGYWNYDTCKEEAKKYKKRVKNDVFILRMA